MQNVFSVNPFLANIPILYPLKTPEKRSISGVFRRYKMGILAINGLTHLSLMFQVKHLLDIG